MSAINEEVRMALAQDSHILRKYEDLKIINRKIKLRWKGLRMKLFWELNFAMDDIKHAEELVNSRWNLFRYWDRKNLIRVRAKYDNVAAKVRAAGFSIEEE